MGGVNMNVFRVLADVSHTASKCILMWAIHSNQSAEGVSLITQILYAVVFCTRYLDLFWVAPSVSYWNFVLKIFYISSSLYIIAIMLRIFPRTREREKAWKFGGLCFFGSLILGPIVALIEHRKNTHLFTILHTFSIVLESVCVLPQLLLLRQTTVPTVIDSFYLVTLGSYRALYILNWILKAAVDKKVDPVDAIFGIIQTALYIDFAWVYWTRQRVKLRSGGVVDSDDLGRGYLIRHLLGKGNDPNDEESEPISGEHQNGNAKPQGTSWGPRGISVSADDHHVPQPNSQKNGQNGNQEHGRTDYEDAD